MFWSIFSRISLWNARSSELDINIWKISVMMEIYAQIRVEKIHYINIYVLNLIPKLSLSDHTVSRHQHEPSAIDLKCLTFTKTHIS